MSVISRPDPSAVSGASSTAPPASAPWRLPAVVRNFVRNREIGLVIVAVVIGLLSGLLVAIIWHLSEFAHAVLFDIPFDTRLSANGVISWQRTLLVPLGGAIILTIIGLFYAGRFKGRLADAIEANALYGGRVSMRGSLLISLQTLLSNGCGASVGLEAGYTQICAAFSSQIGQRLAARRADMRLLVACGAAGAISAAFTAPLAGAFFAFEVVLGAYTSASLVPVIASAVSSWLVMRNLVHPSFLQIPGAPMPASVEMIGQTMLLGVLCAFFSILVMLAVAFSERVFQRISIWRGALRLVIGALLLSGLALLSPTVLGSGHGAMQLLLITNPTWLMLLTTLILKTLASAISLGAGFRGGLFFASLMLGSLMGLLYSTVVGQYFPDVALQPGTAAVAGMVALGTGVIGAPFSMICLALELTGDFWVTIGAVVAASTSALIVRELFGYSFATWRFHLRGETIRGPQDIGWVKQISAATLMRTDFPTAPADLPIVEAQKLFPPARVKQIVLRHADGSYAGIVGSAELHGLVEAADVPLETLAQQQDQFLLPQVTVRDILATFDRTEADILVVIDNAEDRRAIGTVSEAHVLRTYSTELERRNQEVFFR
ncbi:CIC family chloride channel protein [Rhodopseudomonas thermotolerans]|uniref:CIC family chloride channel protein n=2 Tax=Rhodopseudomonas TaxID=1073 RepID=A0A336JMR2_9BRAD|nr:MULTISPECIES: chloride channel protein [Rhodopseudomonas]RED35250.1 CIC family chloride channel protein [Rhodopseudomonas pentothenatexigens]REG03093.1 CIC family chloride channel protein [Rhodopseudomonas thermotolerans]SSW90940.1 CIC family chloride channel protein [Rhodopseudomonas pentothenatexigens]